jgi:hypothetical protein
VNRPSRASVLDAAKALCGGCYCRPATTDIRLADGPLHVCATCEDEWLSLEGI